MVGARRDSSNPGVVEEFHGSSDLIDLTEYWALKSTSEFEGGQLSAFGYLLGSDDVPTIERLTWTIGPLGGVNAAGLERLSESLVAALAPQFGSPERPAPDRILEPGSGFWREVTRLTSPAGVVYVFSLRSRGGVQLDSLVVMRSSARLLAEDAADSSVAYDQREQEGLPALAVLTEVSRALEASFPQLAAALRPGGSRPEDWPTVRAALTRARGRGVSAGERDLLRFASHLWLQSCKTLPGWADGDSAAVRFILDDLKAYGIQLKRSYYGEWCYDGVLAESLAMRAGRSRWADLAFLELMDRGWETPCGLCGWGKAHGPNQFQPVIERGDAYLSAHPNAAIADLVTLQVAEAHETAWSLSRAAADNEVMDPNRYSLAGQEHRRQAFLLYSKLVKKRPDLADENLRSRLRRMRLDIDTNFHRYWCLWD